MTNGWWATTLAWGRKSLLGEDYDAFALESSVKWNHWTLFGRAEWVEENELLAGPGPVYAVGKLSAGAIYDIPLAGHWKLGVGGLVSGYRIPAGLKPLYGSPTSGMAFVRLKLS